jgi:hypothetical protein
MPDVVSSDPVAVETAETVVAGVTTEAKADDVVKAPETVKEIVYDLKIQEGFVPDAVALDSFKALAKSENIPADMAQKILDFGLKWAESGQKANEAKVAESLAKNNAEVLSALKADPELGGANYDSTLALMAAGFQKFATPEQIAMVERCRVFDPDTGKFVSLGQFVPLNTIFRKVALAFKEDTATGAAPARGRTEKTTAQILYGDTPTNE